MGIARVTEAYTSTKMMNAFMQTEQGIQFMKRIKKTGDSGRSNALLQTIQSNPGIHLRGLIDDTGLENGVITHHLSKLEKEGKIKSKKYSRYRRYYSLDVEEEEFDIIRNLRKPTKKKIIFIIIVHGSTNFKDIVSRIDKSPSTVSWNLSELISNDVIERYRQDSKTFYKIKNMKLLKRTFQKEFSKLLDEKEEHSEDIFLGL